MAADLAGNDQRVAALQSRIDDALAGRGAQLAALEATQATHAQRLAALHDASEMLRVLNSLATRVDSSLHPLLDERRTAQAGGKALLFVITADRGLCGSFNTNAIKGASTAAS